jgi:hypothetical protein
MYLCDFLENLVCKKQFNYHPIPWGRFFVHFFWGKFRGKFRGKFFPQKCWGKLKFSAEKVSKNRFSKKFRGIFHGKSLSAETIYKKSAPGHIGPVFLAVVRADTTV